MELCRQWWWFHRLMLHCQCGLCRQWRMERMGKLFRQLWRRHPNPHLHQPRTGQWWRKLLGRIIASL
jgi:hypothetical protein